MLTILAVSAYDSGRYAAYATFVVAALLISGVVGCESAAGGAFDCGRAFDCLISDAAYDTPKELEDVLEPAVRENDASALPAEHLATPESCARA